MKKGSGPKSKWKAKPPKPPKVPKTALEPGSDAWRAAVSEAGLRAQKLAKKFHTKAIYNAVGGFYEVAGRDSKNRFGLFKFGANKTTFTAGAARTPNASVGGTVGGGDAGGGGGDFGDGSDPNQPLIDALADAAAADREHTAAINTLKDEIKRQNDFAGQVTTVSLRAAWIAMADLLAGHIGEQVAGRSLTAGSGTLARY
jgi:hypothetical protein